MYNLHTVDYFHIYICIFFAVVIYVNMIQGLLLSDGFWFTFSHSYTAIIKRRFQPRRKLRSCGLPIGYHHRVFISPNNLKSCQKNLSN